MLQQSQMADVDAENIRSISPSLLAPNGPAVGEHGQGSSSIHPAPVPNYDGEASPSTPPTTEGGHGIEATEEGGIRAGSSTENLTGSVQVWNASTNNSDTEDELESRNLNHGDVTHSIRSSPSVAGPVSHLEEDRNRTQPVRRPASVQSTLTSSFLIPTQPQLPNLALAALQRLAENATDKDDSIDDFRPLKKRKLAPEAEEKSADGEEVIYTQNGLCRAVLTVLLCTPHLIAGSDMFYML